METLNGNTNGKNIFVFPNIDYICPGRMKNMGQKFPLMF
jgi:hypothetical protein